MTRDLVAESCGGPYHGATTLAQPAVPSCCHDVASPTPRTRPAYALPADDARHWPRAGSRHARRHRLSTTARPARPAARRPVAADVARIRAHRTTGAAR